LKSKISLALIFSFQLVFMLRGYTQTIPVSDTLYQHALTASGEGDDRAALQILQHLISNYPDFPRAYEKMVMVYRQFNATDSAVQYFQKIVPPQLMYRAYAIGLALAEQKDDINAESWLQQAVQLSPPYFPVYKAWIDVCDRLKRLPDVLTYLEQSRQDPPYPAVIRYALSYLAIVQQHYDDALHILDEKSEIPLLRLDEYYLKSLVYWNTSQYSQLREISDRGLELAKSQGDREYACIFASNIGLALAYSSDFVQSKAASTQAFEMARVIGNETEMMRSIGNIGMANRESGNPTEALDCFQQALKLSQHLRDQKREALYYRNIGSVWLSLCKYKLALENLNKSLTLTRITGDRKTESLSLWTIGMVFWEYNDYYQALAFFKQALAIGDEVHDKWGISRYSLACGLTYAVLGRYAEALDFYERALKLTRQMGDKFGEAMNLGNIGVIYKAAGDFPRALQYYQQALSISELTGNRVEIARHSGNIGTIYHLWGDYDRAIACYQETIRILHELGNLREESIFLQDLAEIYHLIHRDELAGQKLQQAFSIANRMRYRDILTSIHIKWGELYFDTHQDSAAIYHYHQAMQSNSIIENPFASMFIHQGIAKVAQSQHDRVAALEHYQSALRKLEELRDLMPGDQLKTRFIQHSFDLFDDLIGLCDELDTRFPKKDYGEQAFEFAERSKARALLDILAQGHALHHLSDIPVESREGYLLLENELERKQRALLDTLTRQNNDPDNASVLTCEREIAACKRRLSDFQDDLRQNYPHYYQLINPRILTADEIQRQVLRPHQVLIEYVVGHQQVFRWVVTREKIDFSTLSITTEELKNMLASVSPLFSKSAQPTDAVLDHRWANIQPAMLAKLSDILLPGQTLTEDTELIIVPDDVLYYFPFELLVTSQIGDQPHYLIESCSVSYAASASLLNPELRLKRRPANGLLALGNPTIDAEDSNILMNWLASLTRMSLRFQKDKMALPYAEKEAREIAAFFPDASVYTGADATEANFKSFAAQYRYLHLATHHIVDEKQAMYSHLLLAQDPTHTEDGQLYTYEIYNLRLNADLAVLSGCDTGLGEFQRGEGLINMSRAFLYAGVPAVMVSLWPVQDESTALLMTRFYKHLQDGMEKSRALQGAKIDLIHSQKWTKDPFYWGAFVLVGR